MAERGCVDRIWELRGTLPPGFPSPWHRRELVLLEEWVEGRALGAESSSYLGQAAELLRSLHELKRPEVVRASAYARELELALDQLRDEGKLLARHAESLRKLALEQSPTSGRAALIHHDFCAENLVVAAWGQLFAVDNETVRVEAIELDLARVRYRWPMSATEWRLFLEHYGAQEPAPFWHVLARARGALVRARLGMPRVEEAVTSLLQLLST